MAETIVWWPRDDRRWGWQCDLGPIFNRRYEIEWRRTEGGQSAGYYLFGPGIFGHYLGRGRKHEVQATADHTIKAQATNRQPQGGGDWVTDDQGRLDDGHGDPL